jgi:hypothetical protein
MAGTSPAMTTWLLFGYRPATRALP